MERFLSLALELGLWSLASPTRYGHRLDPMDVHRSRRRIVGRHRIGGAVAGGSRRIQTVGGRLAGRMSHRIADRNGASVLSRRVLRLLRRRRRRRVSGVRFRVWKAKSRHQKTKRIQRRSSSTSLLQKQDITGLKKVKTDDFYDSFAGLVITARFLERNYLGAVNFYH